MKIKPMERLEVGLGIKFPDVNKGLSYKSKSRKIKLFIDDKEAYVHDMDKESDKISMSVRLRTVIIAKNVYERSEGDEVDMIQKYIVGQNFIEVTFPKSGKVRKKKVEFEKFNLLNLLQPQDFWK